MCLRSADPEVQSLAEVGERVAGDDRADRRQPEDEIVVLAARVRGDAERPRSGTMEMSFAFARTQPGKGPHFHAAHAVGIDAELLDPVLPGVCGRRVHREVEPTGVALVVGRRQDDRGRAQSRSSSGTESGSNNTKSSPSSIPYDETSSGPSLFLAPAGMRRLPMPDTRTQLTHGHSLSLPAQPRGSPGARSEVEAARRRAVLGKTAMSDHDRKGIG